MATIVVSYRDLSRRYSNNRCSYRPEDGITTWRHHSWRFIMKRSEVRKRENRHDRYGIAGLCVALFVALVSHSSLPVCLLSCVDL